MNAAALLSRLANLSPQARTCAIAGIAILVAVLAIAVSVTRDNRVPLFSSPLHSEQLNEVQERLAEWNVPFTAGADNLSVEAKRRSELLLRLSLAGVPHEHIESSTDRLARVSALTPQSVIDEQTRNGLAADLELALRGLDGVQDATVIIAPAKPAVFADETSHDASASVRLHMHPGVRLNANAIAGIRSFVAAGVPGLDAGHVTILDDRGVALADDGAGNFDVADLQSSLQSALDAAFGAGTSIVRVHVDYDPRGQQIKEVRRAAASTLPISSERSDELYNGADKRYSKSTHTDDRGSVTREVQTTLAPGRLSRMSVAIVVDENRGAEIYKIRALAIAAAGLDVRRGDSLSVQAIPFHSERTQKKDAWFAAYGALLTVLPLVVIGGLALIGLKLCLKPAAAAIATLSARATIVQTRKAVAGFAPRQVRGALVGEPPHTAAAIISALPAATAAAVLDLYPPEERAAIVKRMSRPHSSLIPDYETVLANA